MLTLYRLVKYMILFLHIISLRKYLYSMELIRLFMFLVLGIIALLVIFTLQTLYRRKLRLRPST
jgi:uncharacterized protein HemY